MGRPTDSIGRKPAVGDCFTGHLRAFDHRKHDALRTEIEGFLGPRGIGFGYAEDGGSAGGGEGVEAGEGGGGAAVAVLHVDDDEVIAGEAGDLGKGGGEGEEEEAVEGLAVSEAGFEGGRGGVGCGEIGRGGDWGRGGF